MKLNIQLFASLNVGDTYETSAVDIKPYGYNANHYQMKFTVKLNSQNLTNFTSNITITSYMRTTGSSWGWSGFRNNIYMERYTKVNDEAGYTLRNSTDIPSLPTNNANVWVNCGSWTNDIPHNSSGVCTLYVKNYLNTTNASNYSYIPRATEQVSEALTLHQLHTPPSLNIQSITETNTYLGVNNNVFVQNLSRKSYAFTPILYDSATATKVVISNGTTTSNDNTTSPKILDFTNKSLYVVSNKVQVKATITDNLGSTGTIDLEYSNPIMYNKPSITATSTTVKRNGQLSGKALLNLVATYYSGTIGSTTNSISVFYKFWEKDTTEPSSWNQINNPTVSGNNITVSNYEIGSNDTSASNYFNPQKAYNVKIYIKDAMRNYNGDYMGDSVIKTIPLGEDVWAEYKDRVRIKKAEIPNGIYSLEAGNVNTSSGKQTLIVKKANSDLDGTPAYGVILEYGTSTNNTGQLFIGTNSTRGIYYNGWSNGVRGTWLKFAFAPVILYNNDTGIQSKSYASVSNLSQYSKLAITFTVYKNSDQANTGGTAHICWLDLTKKDGDGYARSGIVVPYSSNHLSSGNAQTNDFKALFEVDTTNNRVYCLFCYGGSVQTNANYVMTKIEGYYN